MTKVTCKLIPTEQETPLKLQKPRPPTVYLTRHPVNILLVSACITYKLRYHRKLSKVYFDPWRSFKWNSPYDYLLVFNKIYCLTRLLYEIQDCKIWSILFWNFKGHSRSLMAMSDGLYIYDFLPVSISNHVSMMYSHLIHKIVGSNLVTHNVSGPYGPWARFLTKIGSSWPRWKWEPGNIQKKLLRMLLWWVESWYIEVLQGFLFWYVKHFELIQWCKPA